MGSSAYVAVLTPRAVVTGRYALPRRNYVWRGGDGVTQGVSRNAGEVSMEEVRGDVDKVAG